MSLIYPPKPTVGVKAGSARVRVWADTRESTEAVRALKPNKDWIKFKKTDYFYLDFM